MRDKLLAEGIAGVPECTCRGSHIPHAADCAASCQPRVTGREPMGEALTPLPCPCCGYEASADGRVTYGPNNDAWFADGTRIAVAFFCNCPRCGVNNQGIAGGYQTRDEAIAKWNRRAPADLSWALSRIEELKKDAARLDAIEAWTSVGATIIHTDSASKAAALAESPLLHNPELYGEANAPIRDQLDAAIASAPGQYWLAVAAHRAVKSLESPASSDQREPNE